MFNAKALVLSNDITLLPSESWNSWNPGIYTFGFSIKVLGKLLSSCWSFLILWSNTGFRKAEEIILELGPTTALKNLLGNLIGNPTPQKYYKIVCCCFLLFYTKHKWGTGSQRSKITGPFFSQLVQFTWRIRKRFCPRGMPPAESAWQR